MKKIFIIKLIISLLNKKIEKEQFLITQVVVSNQIGTQFLFTENVHIKNEEVSC